MVVVPEEAVAPIIPDVLLTVAMPGAELVHVPPVAVLYNVPEEEGHKLVAPVIDPGVDNTVTTLVAAAPQPVEYEIVAVPPATPYTAPVAALTVATEVLLLVHVPPVAVLDSVVTLPGQTDAVPEIVPGVALTVITLPTAPQDVV